jgi:hypothetical protein
MAIVYQHRRLDTNEIFYVGMGRHIRRAYVGTNIRKIGRKSEYRSEQWANIVMATPIKVEIVYQDLTYEEALEKEKELIKFYGRRDFNLGPLVNHSDGGEGTINPSLEMLAKISRKGYKHTQGAKRKIGYATRKLKTGCKLSENHKILISGRMKGNKHRLGSKHTDESKRKMSLKAKGRKAYNKGIPMKESQKKKLSEIRIDSKVALGSNNPRAKLKEQDVINIRLEYANGNVTHKNLSEKYGVNTRSISNIILRKTWTHI